MGALGEPDDVPPGLSEARIPDDARELDADRLAYYRELAARAREQRRANAPGWQRSPFAAGWFRHGLSGTMLLGALTVIALVGSVMVVLAPRPDPAPTPLPLAADVASVGEPGGLLPDTTVLLGTEERRLRDARPVVLASLPSDGCDAACEQALASVWRQAAQFRVRVALIGPAAMAEQMQAAATSSMSGAPVLVDPTAAVDQAFALSGTAAVLVHADGVVQGVYRDLGPGTRLDAALASLGEPGAPRASPSRT